LPFYEQPRGILMRNFTHVLPVYSPINAPKGTSLS